MKDTRDNICKLCGRQIANLEQVMCQKCIEFWKQYNRKCNTCEHSGDPILCDECMHHPRLKDLYKQIGDDH